MKYCYHTTKIKFLSSILKNGLQPIYGNNSYLTADSRIGKISYSVGIQGATKTFNVFNRFYNAVLDGAINEENFKESLSTQEFAKHQQSIEDIRNSSSFQDWIKDNIYLCFDGDFLSEKNEDKPEDSYTTQSIPAKQLKVCVIKNNRDNTIFSYSMVDIYSFFFAKNPELKKGLCTFRFRENIDKLKSDIYSLELIDLEKIYEMFPELLEEEKTSIENGLTFQQIGLGTTKSVSSKPQEAMKAINALETGIRTQQEIKEGQTQGEN